MFHLILVLQHELHPSLTNKESFMYPYNIVSLKEEAVHTNRGESTHQAREAVDIECKVTKHERFVTYNCFVVRDDKYRHEY